MDKKTWKKIARILKKIYEELEMEALNGGVKLDSPEYDLLVVNAREAILSKFGYTLAQYQEAGEEVEKERRGERPSFEELKTVVDTYKALPVLTKEEVQSIAQETAHKVAKEYIKAPEIINKIVKEIKIQSPPQVIKETIHTTERVEYDDKSLLEELGKIKTRFDEIVIPKVPTEEELQEKIKTTSIASFKNNINLLGMPDFRKLSMGLQAQIDSLSAEIDAVEGGDVDSITGTANQITASASTGDVTLSLPTTIIGVDTLVGGTSTTQDLTFKTTTGVGTTGADMHFLVGNNGATEAMTILNSGNVGIGSTAPAGLLHVSSDTAATGLTYLTQANASADSFDINFRKARGTGASPTVITTADELGVINFTGYGGASGYVTGAAIKAISSGTIADTRVPASLSFWTGTDATPSVLTERMTILNNGRVGIGITAPAEALDVVGDIKASVDVNAVGRVYSGGGSIGFPAFSFIADVNTGMYNPGTDDLALVTGGVVRIYIQDSGNVGIGLTVPSSLLHVQQAADSTNVTTPVGFSVDSVGEAGELTAASGTQVFAAIKPTYNQTSTAGGTDLLINRTETAVGSGAQLLLDAQVGGVSRAKVDNLGNITIGGLTAKTFTESRHTTADTAGNTLTITAGGATSGATDKNGGDLLLQGGLSTGTGESGVQIYGCVAGATGTADRTQTLGIQLLGNKLGFFGVTPVTRQTELTDELTTITFTAPGTPDYAVQDLVQNTGFGFVTKDEGNTVLSVIANLQARVNELETKLTAYGLLIDAD